MHRFWHEFCDHNSEKHEIEIMVIWITGLAGAGKSTFAEGLIKILRRNFQGVIHLDGDQLRDIFGKQSPDSYLRENRLALANTYTKLAKALSEQKFIVVVSTISLFNEIHSWNRRNIKQYIEILLNPPMNILKKRDQKSLYSSNLIGTKKNIIGLDINAEFPTNPEFTFSKFGQIELNKVATKILKTQRGD